MEKSTISIIFGLLGIVTFVQSFKEQASEIKIVYFTVGLILIIIGIIIAATIKRKQ